MFDRVWAAADRLLALPNWSGRVPGDVSEAIRSLKACLETSRLELQHAEATRKELDGLETATVATPKGLWKLFKRGDRICIIDHEARMRHISKGHMLTAQYYASALSEMEFKSCPTIDSALRMSAEDFVAGRRFND